MIVESRGLCESGNRPDIEALLKMAKTEPLQSSDICDGVEKSVMRADKAAIVLYADSIPPEFLINPDAIIRRRGGCCVLRADVKLPDGLLPSSSTNSSEYAPFLSRVMRLNALLNADIPITILTRSESCPRSDGDFGNVVVQAQSVLGRFREKSVSGEGYVYKEPLKVIVLPHDIHMQIAKKTPARTYCWANAGVTETVVMQPVLDDAPASQRSYTKICAEDAARRVAWVNTLLQALGEPTLTERVSRRRPRKPRNQPCVEQTIKCESL